MHLHANSALSLKGRRWLCQRVVDERWTLIQAAEAAEVSVRGARKWVERYRAEGELGLLDRPSAPNVIPYRASEERIQAIEALRRLGFTGPEIAEILGMALSTVSGILLRIGMGKLGRLGPRVLNFHASPAHTASRRASANSCRYTARVTLPVAVPEQASDLVHALLRRRNVLTREVTRR